MHIFQQSQLSLPTSHQGDHSDELRLSGLLLLSARLLCVGVSGGMIVILLLDLPVPSRCALPAVASDTMT